RVLVHRTLEAVNAVGEDPEETVHNPVPVLGTQLSGQLHGPLHVREEHRYLLPLPFESGAGRQDLLGQAFRSVGRGSPGRSRLFPDVGTAIAAELLLGFNRSSASSAGTTEPTSALGAEAAVGTIEVPAR